MAEKEEHLQNPGVSFSFPDASTVPNNKRALVAPAIRAAAYA